MIRFKNYSIEFENGSYNLYKTESYDGRVGMGRGAALSGETKTREIELGYGMKFNRCLQKIAQDSLGEFEGELASYLLEYGKITNELSQIVEETV